MDEREKAIIETVKFYGFLERPLTETELYRYLSAQSGEVSFFDVLQTIENSQAVKNSIRQRNGLLFFGEKDPAASRVKKIKISQQKWKILKRKMKWLSLAPFFEAVISTGSMNLFNCVDRSDFDLLIVAKKNRIWLARLSFMAICEIFGMRRKAGKTENRFCLNCFISKECLEILQKAKPRNFYSAQEYGRMKILIERGQKIFENLQKENLWIKGFLNIYPWPGSESQKIKEIKFLSKFSEIFESIFSGRFGDWLEKEAGKRQSRRIKSNLNSEPMDQIHISPTCLMFHPNSKSFEVMEKMRS